MPDTIDIDVRRQGEAGILEVKGYINSTGGEKVSQVCNELMDEGVHRLAFNLTECRIVNSVGISFLIEIIEKNKALGGRVAFCCVTPTIGKTFRIMGLLQTATLYESEEDALKGIN